MLWLTPNRRQLRPAANNPDYAAATDAVFVVWPREKTRSESLLTVAQKYVAQYYSTLQLSVFSRKTNHGVARG